MEKHVAGERLEIQMFSHFVMRGMGGKLDEDGIRSEMITKLLAYILCHREREISSQELVDVLWQDEESDNPTGALKNLVYRLRTMIKKEWGRGDFVQTGRGAYRWNEAIEVETDAERFDALCKAGEEAGGEEEKLACWLEACRMYRGSFLPKLNGEYWVASLSAYYHSRYITIVKSAVALLEKKGRHSDTVQICTEALRTDNLDETIHGFLVRALVYQGEYKLAQEQYKKAERLLYESLGVAPSEELRSTYDEIMKQTHTEEKDIAMIHGELEEGREAGAFLCDYGVFKETYHLEKRRAERFGVSVFLSLLTLEPKIDYDVKSQAYLNVINEGMSQVLEILLGSLRAGDVISRYSGSQYIIMLPTCQYETAKMVMNRVVNAYENGNKRRKVRLKYSLDEMGTL